MPIGIIGQMLGAPFRNGSRLNAYGAEVEGSNAQSAPHIMQPHESTAMIEILI